MPTKKAIAEMVEKWKEHLRLRDWFVVVKIVKEEDDKDGMDKCSGRVDSIPSVFEAVIEINSKIPDDEYEPTIYHELAHIQTRYIFWHLRQVLESLEAEDSEVLCELLDSCEEEQVRSIEFLISRLLKKKRYLVRYKKEIRKEEI